MPHKYSPMFGMPEELEFDSLSHRYDTYYNLKESYNNMLDKLNNLENDLLVEDTRLFTKGLQGGFEHDPSYLSIFWYEIDQVKKKYESEGWDVHVDTQQRGYYPEYYTTEVSLLGTPKEEDIDITTTEVWKKLFDQVEQLYSQLQRAKEDLLAEHKRIVK